MSALLFLLAAWVVLAVLLRMAEHWFVRFIVETCQAMVGVCLVVVVGTMTLVKIIQWTETEGSCRRAWTDIAEYPVLVEVCRNPETRAALAISVFADEVARNVERVIP